MEDELIVLRFVWVGFHEVRALFKEEREYLIISWQYMHMYIVNAMK